MIKCKEFRQCSLVTLFRGLFTWEGNWELGRELGTATDLYNDTIGIEALHRDVVLTKNDIKLSSLRRFFFMQFRVLVH